MRLFTALLRLLAIGWVVGAAGCGRGPKEALPIGGPMPDFVLSDAGGGRVTLSALTQQRRVVLLNFWATWCEPCREEMPEFERVYQKRKGEGFSIVAISEDEDAEALRKYLSATPPSFRVLTDKDGQVAKKLGIWGFPTSVWIVDGRVTKVIEGKMPFLEVELEAALKLAK